MKSAQRSNLYDQRIFDFNLVTLNKSVPFTWYVYDANIILFNKGIKVRPNHSSVLKSFVNKMYTKSEYLKTYIPVDIPDIPVDRGKGPEVRILSSLALV